MKLCNPLLVLALLLLVLLSGTRSALGQEGETAALKVLVISGNDPALAGGFKNLLAQHGITSTVHAWTEATRERARAFDLVLVTGKGRRFRERNPILDFGRPVLGVGSYGCVYFGRFKLKNGHPYT